MDDQTIRLGLQLTGTETVVAVASATARARDEFGRFVSAAGNAEKATRKVADATQEATGDIYEFADVYEVLDAKLDKVSASMTHVQAATANASAVIAKSGEAGSNAAKRSAQGLLDLSRAAQDWAQGGPAAILNNLEGIGRAIPAVMANPMAMLTSIPGALTLAGTAIYLFGPKLKELFKSIGGGGGDFALSVTRMEGLADAIEKTVERLKEMAKAGVTTIAQAKEYNQLVEKQAGLEKQKSDELERQQKIKKLDALPDKAEADREAERAKELTAALGGQQGDLVTAVVANMDSSVHDRLSKQRDDAQKTLDETGKRANQGDELGPEGLPIAESIRTQMARISRLDKQIDAVVTEMEDRAKDLVAEAVTQGKEAARQKLAATPGLSEGQKAALDLADPKFKEELRRFEAATQQDRADAERGKADPKAVAAARQLRQQQAAAEAARERGRAGNALDRLKAPKFKPPTRAALARQQRQQAAKDRAIRSFFPDLNRSRNRPGTTEPVAPDGGAPQMRAPKGFGGGSAKPGGGAPDLRGVQQSFQEAVFDQDDAFRMAFDQAANTIEGLAWQARMNATQIKSVTDRIAQQNPTRRPGGRTGGSGN